MARSFAGVPDVTRPGNPRYDQACRVYNIAGIPAPAEAVIAATVEQVRAAVRHAAAACRPIRVMSTGHASLSRGTMDDALLIRTELPDAVRIDPYTRTAWVAAGTRWEQVITAAAPHGLAALHGSSPTVGVIGYLLHGGLSFYGRRHGVAANGVRAIELVTAAGDHVRVDAEHDPDLFWALRGGGGGFGIVTAVEIELIDVAATISGTIAWPAELAATLVPAWRDWAASAPREITTSLRLLNLPLLPHVPAPLAGAQSLCITGSAIAATAAESDTTEQTVAELLEPLRAIAEPNLDTWRTVSPVEVLRTQMDPEFPIPVRSDHSLLAALPDATIEGLLHTAGPTSGSPLLAVELRHLGGAFATPRQPGGAFDRITAPWLYFAAGIAPDDDATEAITDQFAANNAVLAPSTTPYTAPSFVENTHQHQHTFDAESARAVAAIRQRHDPDGLFRGDVAGGSIHALTRPSIRTADSCRSPNPAP